MLNVIDNLRVYSNEDRITVKEFTHAHEKTKGNE